MIPDVLCCGLLVGALLVVTKASIILQEMYEPGIGVRLMGDNMVLGFILVVIILRLSFSSAVLKLLLRH